MSQYQKLLLQSTDDFTTFGSTALYTNASGTFDATETSMYAEVVGLASTTGYGGASLGNQTHRYLLATATKQDSSSGIVYDANTAFDQNYMSSNSQSINTYLADSSGWTVTPTGHTSFSAIQTSLEDDGKHFITYAHSGASFTRYHLLIDKNNLGGGSGSSSSSSSSAMSWAYSSQSATDPNVLLDWTTPTPDYSVTTDLTDWKADLKSKITAKGLSASDLLLDWELEMNNQHRSIDPNNQNTINNFIEYINKKINTQ